MLLLALSSLAVALLVSYLFKLARVLLSTHGQPGFVTLFPPYSVLPSFFLSQRRRLFFARAGSFASKAEFYRDCNSTAIYVTSLIPPTRTLFVGEGRLIHQINEDRKTFTKPSGSNTPVLSIFGPNLLTSDGEDWRRHRRVSVTSFSEKNVEKVWEETGRVVKEWQEKLEGEMGERGGVDVQGFENVTAAIAMLVIGKAAFGLTFPFPSTFTSPPVLGSSSSSASSFLDTLKLVLRNGTLPSLLPGWILRHAPGGKVRRVRELYEGFEREMRGILEERRREIVAEEKEGGAEDKNDLHSALVRANMREEGKAKLSEQELVSDLFIYLVAGHDTSSHAIASLFLLLALYPSHQDAVHAEINSYLSTTPSFTYPDAFNALKVTTATVQEGLRLAGPVNATIKYAARDAVLEARTVPQKEGGKGEKREVVVPAGTWIRENISGAHYQPGDFPDPFDFDPSRFLSDITPDGYIPFSDGLRGCIGKKFALAEMVSLLALTLHRYRLSIPPSRAAEYALQPGETERERRDRVLKPAWPFTMAPSEIGIRFERREGQGGTGKVATEK